MPLTLDEISAFWNLVKSDTEFKRQHPAAHFAAAQPLYNDFKEYLYQIAGAKIENKSTIFSLLSRLKKLNDEPALSTDEKDIVAKLLADIDTKSNGTELKILIESQAKELEINDNHEKVSTLVGILENRTDHLKVEKKLKVEEDQLDLSLMSEADRALWKQEEEKKKQEKEQKRQQELLALHHIPHSIITGSSLNDVKTSEDLGDQFYQEKKYEQAASYYLQELKKISQQSHKAVDPESYSQLNQFCGESIYRVHQEMLSSSKINFFKENLSLIQPALVAYMKWAIETDAKSGEKKDIVNLQSYLKMLIQFIIKGISNQDTLGILNKLQEIYEAKGGIGKYIVDCLPLPAYGSESPADTFVELLSNITDLHTAAPVSQLLKSQDNGYNWTQTLFESNPAISTANEFMHLLNSLQKNDCKREVFTLLESQVNDAKSTFASFLNTSTEFKRHFFDTISGLCRGEHAVASEQIIILLDKTIANIDAHYFNQSTLDDLESFKTRILRELKVDHKILAKRGEMSFLNKLESIKEMPPLDIPPLEPLSAVDEREANRLKEDNSSAPASPRADVRNAIRANFPRKKQGDFFKMKSSSSISEQNSEEQSGTATPQHPKKDPPGSR